MCKESLQMAMCRIHVYWQLHQEVEIFKAPWHVKQGDPVSSFLGSSQSIYEINYWMSICGGVAQKKIRFVPLWKSKSLWKGRGVKNRNPGTPPIHTLASWESIRNASTPCLTIGVTLILRKLDLKALFPEDTSFLLALSLLGFLWGSSPWFPVLRSSV